MAIADMASLAEANPEQARRTITSRGLKPYADALVAALEHGAGMHGAKKCPQCNRPHRESWAFRTFPRIARLVDPPTIVAILERVGCSSETELDSLLNSGRRLKAIEQADVSVEAQVEDAIEVLRLVLRDRPEWRAQVIARLSSGAEVVPETNGHANGNGAHS